MTAKKVAKLWVNHASMAGDPSAHVSYLTNGHQLSADEQARVWTKSIPKACKADQAVLVKHWRGIHERFIEARQTPGSSVHHNARVTARQFVINLPNDISEAQVNQLAKAVLQDFPRHIPVTMVLHRTSNRGKQHLHLQGLFSYRNGGYGAILEDFRMNITGQMKQTVAGMFERFGYEVDHGRPGSINTKERRWLNQQGTTEQRRNPRFMTALASRLTSKRLRDYCLKIAASMLSKMPQSQPAGMLMQTMNTMCELSTTYCKTANIRPLHDTPAPTERAEHKPLTPQERLQKQLFRARAWTHTRKISKSIKR
ncbi:hypothetical protein [Desulfopila aestuarii]|uniref:Relaxase/Mobilisation nuclease domain-containing protein n=1 Tax=Desulfopila aestuarii DSM 18488 TaxID=1121416 RepID=A0A1M7YK34_9BACT|nr:hypothetical protein [Desulfopila aestuarii]SHO52973.1 hypothetical protein SAMN02745220_04863 [Desulfopila aestuarii DSM 18488]